MPPYNYARHSNAFLAKKIVVKKRRKLYQSAQQALIITSKTDFVPI